MTLSLPGILKELEHTFQRMMFTRSQQQAFLEDVGELVEDGVPVILAVETVGEIMTGPTTEVVKSILQSLGEGNRFAEGMEGWFPQAIIEIVRAGEQGGMLSRNIRSAAKSLAQQTNAVSTILAATLYPFLVLVMGMAVAVYIKGSVMMTFSSMKPVSTWPAVGQTVYQVATFMESWWWIIIAVLVFLAIVLARTMRDLTGSPRQVIDAFPLFSIYRDVTAARFMETLGLLLENGIALRKSLQLLQHKASSYLTWHLLSMEHRLSGGLENIAEVLDTGLIKPSSILRLRVVAKGKGFEHALVRLGQLASQQNIRTVNLTAKVIGGGLLFLGAAWAITLVFGIYSVGMFVSG